MIFFFYFYFFFDEGADPAPNDMGNRGFLSDSPLEHLLPCGGILFLSFDVGKSKTNRVSNSLKASSFYAKCW